MKLTKKQVLILVITLVIVIGGVFLTLNIKKPAEEPTVSEEPGQVEEKPSPRSQVIGQSVEGRGITAYTYGKGDTRLLFVGGIHGGYEWNSVLLSYKFIDYLETSPGIIPENVKVTVIPALNPDGLYEITGKEGRFKVSDVKEDGPTGEGRFNANKVDLNRNFNCKWKPESTWRRQTVSAGTEAFSEPEAVALRDFVLETEPRAVVFWHSQSNAVYASECEEGVLPETIDIMNAYSDASQYRSVESFTAYEITGDAEGWLASINIPAITVELSTHETVEWAQNLEGVKALFNYYQK